MPFFSYISTELIHSKYKKKLVLIIYLVIITTIFQAVEGEIEDEKGNIVVIPNTHKMEETRKRPTTKLNVCIGKYAFCLIFLCVG